MKTELDEARLEPDDAQPEPSAASEPRFSRLLIVDDDERLATELSEQLRDLAKESRCCHTALEAIKVLHEWKPEFLLLDIKLPDGDAVSLLEQCAELSPRPVIIAMSGVADAKQTFRLGQLGVREFIAKPFKAQDARAAIHRAQSTAPDVRPHVKNLLGHVGLKRAEETVRDTLVTEALERTSGSRRGAARLLDMTRQALQHIIRRKS